MSIKIIRKYYIDESMSENCNWPIWLDEIVGFVPEGKEVVLPERTNSCYYKVGTLKEVGDEFLK